MKLVYRFQNNEEYWDSRWGDAGRDKDTFDRLDIYPIRYAEMVMTDRNARAVEIGCGLGRVLKHYRHQGFNVVGIERSRVAVTKLLEELGPEVIREGDACALPYPDASFDVAMAFGVYHNLETGIDRGLAEIARILKPGGRCCISMRPDNIEMNLNELYWRRRNPPKAGATPQFHKCLVKEKEFIDMLDAVGLSVISVHHARNVSLLYRLPFLRAGQKTEEERRAGGYRLNAVGRFLDSLLVRLLPYQTANVLVFIAQMR